MRPFSEYFKSTLFVRPGGWGGVLWLGLLLQSLLGEAQPIKKYLVVLKDKAHTPYSLNNPSTFLSPRSVERRLRQNIPLTMRDLPVSPDYLASIGQTGGKVWYTSRWLNAALVEADSFTLIKLLQLPFVKGLEEGRPLMQARSAAGKRLSGGQAIGKEKTVGVRTQMETTPLAYGPSASQVAMLGADEMHRQGYHGEGMRVAVLDAGFRNVDKATHFRKLFAENRLVSTYDFVRNEISVFEDDSHGAQVLGALAGYQEGRLIGTAYQAEYILLRTEDVSSESRLEEANWLMAAEYADSAGVDVLNSSLGYSTFDDPAQSYTYADLNGQKALITRAADWAAGVGILVVNSAGNEGSSSWQYITPPADGDSVLAVASVSRERIRAASSSKGPSADRRVKPDLAALGQGTVVGTSTDGVVTSSGTSFAAPVLAGMAVGFWQAHPQLTNIQVIEYLKRSGSQYARPDSLLGYGIPTFARASALVSLQKSADGKPFVFPNPFEAGTNPQVWLGNLPKGQRYTATLSDAKGRVRWSGALLNELTPLPAANLVLPPGYYFLKVISDGGASVTTKLLCL